MVKIDAVKIKGRKYKIETIYNNLKKQATNKKDFIKKFKGYKQNPDKSFRLANIYQDILTLKKK